MTRAGALRAGKESARERTAHASVRCAGRRRNAVPPTPSRRQFLNLVGRAGGTTAVYNTMAAMGLLPLPAAYAGPPALEPASGHGVRVVVLGAGIAGMTAAYELSKA